MGTVLSRTPPEFYPSPNEVEQKPQFPGIPTTSDGAGMVVWVETHITQGACAYPITSSTTMGGGYQVEVANGKRNLWGEELAFIEPESEHSAATTCEGFAVAGGRVTNFTSGQGLILMKEVLYTISGKRLPIVFHIGARALTSQSLNVHAGHDDVVGVCRLRLGRPLRAQRPGGRRFRPHRAPRRRGHRDAVPQRPGRLPHHPHHRKRPPSRARADEALRRRSLRLHVRNLMDPQIPADVRRGAEPGQPT